MKTKIYSLLTLASTALLAAPAAEPEHFGSLDLDQLAEIQIITSSKRPEALAGVPAAVRVAAGDEIVRSGSTTIPEALRAVPGLNVAQINGSTWGIGARGFQAQYSSKLLVMMDGRSIYTPMFGGVNWEIQNYLIEDLDRIEVVLGPGGSIWGANAMNGVINVITKSARDTLGGLAYGGGGNEKQVLAGGRYGWHLGESNYGRVYLQYDRTDDTQRRDGSAGDDSFEIARAGFRFDGALQERSQWTLQADGYVGREEFQLDQPDLAAPPAYSVTENGDTDVSGGYLMGKWQTAFGPDSTLSLQGYYDYVQRSQPIVDNRIHTLDFELHHSWSGWDQHQIDWGFGIRWVGDETFDARVTFVPPETSTHLFSAFVQDEWWLVRERLALTAGGKLEHNEYTGLEPQPNVRLTWHPSQAHTLWAAWSRAVRTPARVEEGGQFDAAILPPGALHPTLPAAVHVTGSTDLDAEHLEAWELGWRWRISDRVNLDASGFYYEYNDLILVTPQGPPYTNLNALIVPNYFVNAMDGHSYGGEIAMQWEPADGWRLRAGYAHVQIHLDPQAPDPFGFSDAESNSPQNTLSLWSFLQLGRNWNFDTGLRFVDDVPASQISSYVELDARLAWRPHPSWELSLVGQNLLHDQHAEATPSPFGEPTEIQRSVYAKATVRF